MKRPPYFPFYVTDFAADPLVEAMSTKGVGAYILLLCKAWHLDPPASLPDEDCTLARWARLPSDQWAEVRSEVLAAFKLGADGRHHQKRLRQEYEHFAVKSQLARKAALAKHSAASALRPQKKRTPTRGYGSGSTSEISGGGGGCKGADPPGFARFWESRPRSSRWTERAKTLAKWRTLGLEARADEVIRSLEAWKASREWQKNGGEFIPGPLPWIEAERFSIFPLPASNTRPVSDRRREIDALFEKKESA